MNNETLDRDTLIEYVSVMRDYYLALKMDVEANIFDELALTFAMQDLKLEAEIFRREISKLSSD